MTTEGQNTPVSTPSGPSAGLEGQDATQETQDAADREPAYDDLRAHIMADVAALMNDRAQMWEDDNRPVLARESRDLANAFRTYAEGVGVPSMETLRQKRRAAEARVAELEATLRAAISTFAYPTHPGRECRQSGHVPIETLRRWQAILDAPKDTTAP